MFTISFMPKKENWTRNKNRGESSSQNTDHEYESKVIDYSSTKNPK
jgi:hypothetical protein